MPPNFSEATQKCRNAVKKKVLPHFFGWVVTHLLRNPLSPKNWHPTEIRGVLNLDYPERDVQMVRSSNSLSSHIRQDKVFGDDHFANLITK